MSKLVATAGDQHTCPMYSGTTPHVGGTIISGSPNVFVNDRPVARMGDKCICSDGSISIIIQGETGILVDGKPIAYVGCMTSHGGVISTGQPNVIIETAMPVKTSQLVTMPIELMPPTPARTMLDRINALANSKKARESKSKQQELKKHGYLVDVSFSM
ncbi:PAAR domain-containing protein [Aquimarina longa]|uniref:PAAR domain-containing protein n=1 Tax=Aquimarina longa TaxID=1080221 RepID=UPI0009E75A2E|nr:PAAR domain-containing protein [Aquimarina longa]